MSILFSGCRLRAGNSGVRIAVLSAAFLVSPFSSAINLPEVEQQALARAQPGVLAANARSLALNEQAGVAATLPPPQLILGLEDMPVTGSSAGTLPPAGDGMMVAGVMQMFPSARQRELQSARLRAEAGTASAMARGSRRVTLQFIRLAYIDLWQATETLTLARQVEQESHHHLQALDAAYRSGRATLADRDGAAVKLAMAQDAVADGEQQRDEAAVRLARWTSAEVDIGEVQLPALSELPSEAALLEALPAHPDLQAIQSDLDARRTGVDVAQAGARPDWRLEARYGWRGNMPDTASVMLGVDLPLLSANRRRHQVAGALLDVEEGEAMREDRLRELRAAIVSGARLHSRLQSRLAAYDSGIVTTAQRRAEAALAGYRHGRDDLGDVVEARIDAIDAEQKRLSLQADLFRVQAQLLYFAPETTQGPGL